MILTLQFHNYFIKKQNPYKTFLLKDQSHFHFISNQQNVKRFNQLKCLIDQNPSMLRGLFIKLHVEWKTKKKIYYEGNRLGIWWRERVRAGVVDGRTRAEHLLKVGGQRVKPLVLYTPEKVSLSLKHCAKARYSIGECILFGANRSQDNKTHTVNGVSREAINHRRLRYV